MLVGDIVRQRVPLWATCRGGGHRARVDPGRVADRLGYDVPLPSLAPKTRCARCGGHKAALSVGHDNPRAQR